MTTLDDRLLPVFAAQHWLVGVDDVVAAGGTASMARDRVQSGRWSQADVNVYRLVGVPSSWHSRLLAPILAIGGGAVASHFAAAALHGIEGFGRGSPGDLHPERARAPPNRHHGPHQHRPRPLRDRGRRGHPGDGGEPHAARHRSSRRRRAPVARHRVGSPRATDRLAGAGRHAGSPRPSWSPGHPTPATGDRGQHRSRRGHRFRLRAARAGTHRGGRAAHAHAAPLRVRR